MFSHSGEELKGKEQQQHNDSWLSKQKGENRRKSSTPKAGNNTPGVQLFLFGSSGAPACLSSCSSSLLNATVQESAFQPFPCGEEPAVEMPYITVEEALTSYPNQ